jgi:hypothetical protein
VKTGREEFDILNPLNFAGSTERKQVHSATLSATMFRTMYKGNQTFTAAYTHQRAFEAAKESTACMAGPATSQQTCKNGVFAAPIQSDKSLLSLDFRMRFNSVLGEQPAALQVKVTQDFRADVTGVDVPVYLFSIGEELNAGVRFGWESKTDSGNVGFFYGQKF